MPFYSAMNAIPAGAQVNQIRAIVACMQGCYRYVSTHTNQDKLLQLSENTFDVKRRNLISGPHLLGSLLVLSGMIALVGSSSVSFGASLERHLAVGTAAILLGLFIVSTYGGTCIDFAGNRYRGYWSIAGFKQGAWKTLPPIAHVTLIATDRRQTNQPNGISPTLSGNVTEFKLLAYSKVPRPLLSFTYENRDKALEQAQRLASGLNCKLVLHIPQSS